MLRDAIRRDRQNPAEPERLFAAMADSADDAFNNVLYAVQDGADVYRTVLPYRFVGPDEHH